MSPTLRQRLICWCVVNGQLCSVLPPLLRAMYCDPWATSRDSTCFTLHTFIWSISCLSGHYKGFQTPHVNDGPARQTNLFHDPHGQQGERAPQARGVSAHDVPKIVAIAGQRIGMLSHAATSIADLGKDTDGESPCSALCNAHVGPYPDFKWADSM